MARGVGLQLAAADGTDPPAAARAHLAGREGRDGQGEDVLDAGADHARAASGLLMRDKNHNRRGVALILVLTTVAILTAIGVDFSYGSRVNLHLAENARDELRAYYLARSAVNLSRLLLHFQKQVDTPGGRAAQQLANLLRGGNAQPAAPAPGALATAAPAANNLGIRLWEILPVDSNAMGALLGGGDLSA